MHYVDKPPAANAESNAQRGRNWTRKGGRVWTRFDSLPLASVHDPLNRRDRRNRDLEYPHHRQDARKADVGNTHHVTMAEYPGLRLARQPRLDCLQPNRKPMHLPGPPRRIIETSGPGQIFLYPRRNQRMRISRHDVIDRTRARP